MIPTTISGGVIRSDSEKPSTDDRTLARLSPGASFINRETAVRMGLDPADRVTMEITWRGTVYTIIDGETLEEL